MPEVVVHGLEMVVKSIVNWRMQLSDGQIIEGVSSRARVVIKPEDRIREPGEELVRLDPVLQVNSTTGGVSIT